MQERWSLPAWASAFLIRWALHGCQDAPSTRPFAGTLGPLGTDPPLHIGLHRHLQHRLGDTAKEATISCFRQQIGQ